MELFNNVNSIFRVVASEKIRQGATVVDGTVGNGNDIEYMLGIIGESGFAYGFDIQKIAIENTEKRLSEKGFNKNYKIINDGHENIRKYIDEKIDFAVYNLGYLPKGDHKLITKAKSTIKSIESVLELLSEYGCVIISAYVGHKGGMEEYDSILQFSESLNQKEFNVLKLEFTNQINTPPKMILIEKRKYK